MAEQHSHTADFESRYKFNSLSQLDKVLAEKHKNFKTNAILSHFFAIFGTNYN